MDTVEDLRSKLMAQAKELTEHIATSYRPEMAKAREPERVADLYRQMRSDIALATAPIVRTLAGLPPPMPIIFTPGAGYHL